MEKAIAGVIGEEQDDSQASYAALFSEEEHWIDWQEPHNVLNRKVLALNGLGAGVAKTKVANEDYRIFALDLMDQRSESNRTIGDCLERSEDSLVIQALEGPVRIRIK